MKRTFGFILFSSFALALPAIAQWEPDMRLTYDPRNSMTSSNNAWCVAATGDTVHVVWMDFRDGVLTEIYTKRSSDGGVSWGPDTRLTYDDMESNFPSVAASGSNVHVAWCDTRDGGGEEIYAKRSSDWGISWGPDTRLTYDSTRSVQPSVAASGNNAHVVWWDERDGNREIYTKRSTNGGVSWGPDTRLTNDSMWSGSPSVAASGSNVHVVWFDWRDLNYEIYTKRSTDGGASWGPDTRLTYNIVESWDPSVAASGSDVHVVWYDNRDGNYEIYTKCSTDGGASWGSDTRLTDHPAISGQPSVAASGGNVHVVWTDYRDGNPEIYTKRSSDRGLSWGPDTRLTNDTALSCQPSVAASGNKVHVVWDEGRDGNEEIYYKRNPTGNIGVETNKGVGGPRVQGVKITPNPFTSFAQVPGHEAERFAVYDISGRKVGAYPGSRIGEGLGPGVYFLRKEGSSTAPLRAVKVR